MTQPREIILDVLSRTKKHLSAEDIYIEVYKIYPGIGLTTIYRTLDILTNMEMVSRYDFGDGRSRYELISDKKSEHHHHLICLNCGKIIDYNDYIDEETKLFDKLEKVLSEKHNFKINYHHVGFYGLCDKCKSTTSS
ncbi:MAG: transcriptional repressor [Actinomycetia bacterium]|nr:transcriptional repressor [Actinomycetes bacterium]